MVKPSNTRLLKEKMEKLYSAEGEESVYNHYIDEAERLSFENEEEPCFAVSEYFQLYNNDKRKNANLKKQSHQKISTEDLTAVTQLFTPLYLVKYVADNTLGRMLRGMGYGIETPYLDGGITESRKKLRGVKIFDPAAGTGNMLFYACELLTAAYKKEGLSDCEIKKNIQNNLVGFDIDKRAAELCQRLFKKRYGVSVKIYTPPENPDTAKYLESRGYLNLAETYRRFFERGSASIFDIKEMKALQKEIHLAPENLKKDLSYFYDLLEILNGGYDVILVNPPYLASSDYSKELGDFIKKNYRNYRADLFSVFIARSLKWLKPGGFLGVVCPYNWMFIKQFSKLREKIIDNYDIINLVMLPTGGYRNAVVYLSCFALYGGKTEKDGSYIKLSNANNTEEDLLNSCRGRTEYKYFVNQERFKQTPNNSLIFWTGSRFIENYRYGRLKDYMEIRQGMATGDNKKYLKKIEDANKKEIAFDAKSIEDFKNSGKKYALYNKGGAFRKWYGNRDYVILFDDKAREELKRQGNNMPSRAYYFKPSVTWTLVSSKGYFGARISDNSVFDVGGSCGFPKDPADIYVILGYLCSAVATYYLNAHNPTLNCQVGDIKNLPYIPPSKEERTRIEQLVKENIDISKKDWEDKIKDADEAKKNFLRLKENEEELNKIFIGLYGLDGELSAEVPDRLITLKYKGERV